VIELGPDGGDGGVVVAEGTPKQVSRAKTATAPILRELLRTWPGG
jgi:excinuclease ABC subunit A